MRKRLSWDETKTAEIMKQADPYTMNQERSNPPVSKYETGNPSAWGEDQNMAKPWEHEGRTETGHPAPAREAVVQARKLEDKALKCITIAQRMLPGAEDTLVEDQATDFMFMPERAIMATLQRQADLATKIAGEQCDEKEEEEKEEEKKEAKKAPAKEEDEEMEVEAKKAPVKEEDDEAICAKKAPAKEEEEMEVEAKKAPAKEEDDEAVCAKKAPAKEEEEEMEVEAKKAPAKEEVEKEASQDLLDVLFDNAEMIPQEKIGAKKLSGLVKQASGSDPLAGLWETPPDISSVFGRNR